MVITIKLSYTNHKIKGYGHIRIDGKTPAEVRQAYCDKFQHDEQCLVAVLSITTANAGIIYCMALYITMSTSNHACRFDFDSCLHCSVCGTLLEPGGKWTQAYSMATHVICTMQAKLKCICTRSMGIGNIVYITIGWAQSMLCALRLQNYQKKLIQTWKWSLVTVHVVCIAPAKLPEKINSNLEMVSC